MLLPMVDFKILFAGAAGAFCFALWLSRVFASRASSATVNGEAPGLVKSLLLFAYSCFLKPHEGDGKGTQQDALESFYKTQAGVYDSTRRTLLKGREDMLALVAAHLEAKAEKNGGEKLRRIWIDVGHTFDLKITITRLMLLRWAEVQDGISRPWPESPMYGSFSP